MAQPNTSSPALPASERVEVFYVRLANGKIVARTAEELAELPPELKSELVFISSKGTNA